MSRWPRPTRWVDARPSAVRVLDAAGVLVRTIEPEYHADPREEDRLDPAKTARGRRQAAMTVRRRRGRPRAVTA